MLHNRALAICFPDWFYFASVLLFSNNSFEKGFQSKYMPGGYESGQISGMEQPSTAAARYMAWILSPHSKSHRDMVFDSLTKISESWAQKRIASGSSGKGLLGSRKKLKKLKCHETENDFNLTSKYECEVIGLWLKDFQTVMKYVVGSVNTFASQNSTFFRRILLGLLIGFPDHVKEDGFELLLHYAATGKILHSTNKTNKMEYRERYPGDLEDFGVNFECTEKEAVAGACVVFCLTDIAERMPPLLFKSEKGEMDIVCMVKLRVSWYLIKCIKRLLQSIIDEDGDIMLTDLHDKLEHWRHQGKEMFELDKELDDVIKGLSNTLLSL